MWVELLANFVKDSDIDRARGNLGLDAGHGIKFEEPGGLGLLDREEVKGAVFCSHKEERGQAV